MKWNKGKLEKKIEMQKKKENKSKKEEINEEENGKWKRYKRKRKGK